FALSGYLLYWPFARRDFGAGPDLNARRYAWNRAVRVLPLYYVVLAVLLLVNEHGGTWTEWWRFGLFLQNFSHHTIQRVDGALWSLVVEVQFYALLPLFALGLAWLSRRAPARAAAIVTVLGLLSVVLRQPTRSNPLWLYSFPSTFVFFVPGLLLALLRTRCRQPPAAWLPSGLARRDPWLIGGVAVWLPLFINYSLDELATIASFLIVGSCVLPR